MHTHIDPNAPLCQDDYEYATGTGIYKPEAEYVNLHPDCPEFCNDGVLCSAGEHGEDVPCPLHGLAQGEGRWATKDEEEILNAAPDADPNTVNPGTLVGLLFFPHGWAVGRLDDELCFCGDGSCSYYDFSDRAVLVP